MDENLIEAVEEHIGRHIAPPSNVFHELIPTSDLHIDVHVVAATPDRPHITLVTSGMSEFATSVPDEVAEHVTPYVELMLALPADWQIDQLRDPRWNWPIWWLRFLAKYPHEFNTWLWVSHTIPNSEDCDPFAPDTDLCCWFVRIPATVPEDFCEMTYDERTIGFLALCPIYRHEMEFAISHDNGLYALDQALTEAGVTELIDPHRPPLTLEQMEAHLEDEA